MVEHRYTRYPLYEGHIKNILGGVHTKDVFAASQQQSLVRDLKALARPLQKVAARSSALKLLQLFRKGAVHMALVYEKEALVGFVTLDNLLQVIIGRIKDEFHRTTRDWKRLNDGSYALKGHASTYILEQLFDIDLSHYPVTTVSGLILHVLERFPERGEKLQFEGFAVEVLKVAAPKISLVKVRPLKQIAPHKIQTTRPTEN